MQETPLEQPGFSAPLIALGPVLQAAGIEAAATDQGAATLHFRARRNPLVLKVLTPVFLIWSACWVLALAAHLWQAVCGFGFFEIILLWVVVNRWFGTLTVTIDAAGLGWETRCLGLRRRMGVSRADIAGIAVTDGEYVLNRTLYAVHIHRRVGRPVRIPTLLGDHRVAAQLVACLQAQYGVGEAPELP